MAHSSLCKIYKIENANLSTDSLEQVVDFDTHIARIHPDDQPAIQDKIDRHLKGEEGYYEAQYRMPRPYSSDWEWVLSRGRIVEFNKDGSKVILSIWDMDGEIIVYDANTLEEEKRLPMVKPSGKYNVWNKTQYERGTSH